MGTCRLRITESLASLNNIDDIPKFLMSRKGEKEDFSAGAPYRLKAVAR